MMAGLLFARAGCEVLVLEKHADFFRDFRGDTVHPSTMEILNDLGMLERFLKRPHSKIEHAELRLGGKEWRIAEFSRLHTVAPFIAMMPQWEFLDFLRVEGKAYPGFHLSMSTPVAGFLEEAGKVVGVRLNDGTELNDMKVILSFPQKPDGKIVKVPLSIYTTQAVPNPGLLPGARSARQSFARFGSPQSHPTSAPGCRASARPG